MGRSKSHHKEEKRKCPQCGKPKKYPVRNETCSTECANAKRRSQSNSQIPDESQIRTEDSWNIHLKKTRIASLEELIAAYRVNLSEWEVVEWRANKWEVGYSPKATKAHEYTSWVRPSSKMRVEPLFQVTARFKPRKNIQAAIREIASLKEDAIKSSPRAPRPTVYTPTGNMLEINIPDIHIGKVAPGYSVEEAVALVKKALETLLLRSSWVKYEQIVFVIGNDLLNFDDQLGRTTAGTQVTMSAPYKSAYRSTRKLLIDMIERMRQVAHVKVIVVPGNHDSLTSWTLGTSLEWQFENYTDVTVDNSDSTRKFHAFGKVMIMYTHGHKGKKNDKPLVMATEQRKMWGAAEYCEVHQAHTHGADMVENHGVRVITLPALCPADEWHEENEYTGNLRSAEARIYNKNEGMIGMSSFNHTAHA